MNEIRFIQRMRYSSVAATLLLMALGFYLIKQYGHDSVWIFVCGWSAGLACAFGRNCEDAIKEMKQTLKNNEEREGTIE